MSEWYRNTDWNQHIEEFFELKLERARSGESKAQYLRIQATYLLETTKYSSVGVILMRRLFNEFPHETFSIIFGHEQLGDYYFKNKHYKDAEIEYNIVVEFYHKNYRGGTTGLADIKLADLIITTEQIDKFSLAYAMITDGFQKSGGNLTMNDSKYYYSLIRARLAHRLGFLSDSREHAKLAFDLSEITEPQFSRHKTVGIAKAKRNEIKELKRILKK